MGILPATKAFGIARLIGVHSTCDPAEKACARRGLRTHAPATAAPLRFPAAQQTLEQHCKEVRSVLSSVPASYEWSLRLQHDLLRLHAHNLRSIVPRYCHQKTPKRVRTQRLPLGTCPPSRTPSLHKSALPRSELPCLRSF